MLQVDARAPILIAGQAPGRRVHESGVPFQDPSGERLRDWMGIGLDDFYDPTKVAILPMGFCYPGSKGSGDAPPRPECARTWRRVVLDHLSRVELTLVLGSHAQRYHLGAGGSVTEHVAAWRDHWPTVLPLPHPSPRNQGWFTRNGWFLDEVIPLLRVRVRQLIVGTA